MSVEPDVGEGEVLTGAELYHYLLEENASQLAKNAKKIDEYKQLQTTLQSLTDRCRRTILAPIAGGLAYWDAELDATNNVLVLLGDGWFAERSARQSADIVQRRLDFLRREQQVLTEERNTLTARQELFASEAPNASAALRAVASHSSAVVGSDAARGTTASGGAVPAAGRPVGAPSVTAADAEELAVFDEQDELTEDELIALEKELCDRIDDDAYVERVIMERMIAKKERRVQAELAVRQQHSPPASDGGMTASGSHSGVRVAPAAPMSAPVPFRSPADIGAATTLTAQQLPQAPSAAGSGAVLSSVVPTTAVFADDAPAPEPTSEKATKRVSFAVDSAPQPPAPSAPPTRSSYALGDIVDRPSGSADGAAAPLGPAVLGPTGERGRPTRKSLFQRELEGGS